MKKKLKTFLLSALAKKFVQAGFEAFQKEHPVEWLLWEPGTWRPPDENTLAVPKGVMTAATTGGEALAMVLEPVGEKREVVLGRSDDADITINDGTLSSRHLVLTKELTGWTVRDAGSRNGSKLNGAGLAPGVPSQLQSGARIVAGQVALTFYAPDQMFARVKQSVK